MTFWVHRSADGLPWHEATGFDPPFERVSGKGYPHYQVQYADFTFEFASLAEMDACIATLSRPNLPDTARETTERGTGPGARWLNRLPGQVRKWSYREKAVDYLRQARQAFAAEAGTS